MNKAASTVGTSQGGTLALIALVTIPQASLLGDLLAQVAAFIPVSVAGIVFPYRLRHVWEAGGGHKLLGIPSVTLTGIGGVIVLGSLMLTFILNSTINSAFGVTARLSLSFMKADYPQGPGMRSEFWGPRGSLKTMPGGCMLAN
jgi:hypothetical protein